MVAHAKTVIPKLLRQAIAQEHKDRAARKCGFVWPTTRSKCLGPGFHLPLSVQVGDLNSTGTLKMLLRGDDPEISLETTYRKFKIDQIIGAETMWTDGWKGWYNT